MSGTALETASTAVEEAQEAVEVEAAVVEAEAAEAAEIVTEAAETIVEAVEEQEEQLSWLNVRLEAISDGFNRLENQMMQAISMLSILRPPDPEPPIVVEVTEPEPETPEPETPEPNADHTTSDPEPDADRDGPPAVAPDPVEPARKGRHRPRY
jgi:hypothetical protein